MDAVFFIAIDTRSAERASQRPFPQRRRFSSFVWPFERHPNMDEGRCDASITSLCLTLSVVEVENGNVDRSKASGSHAAATPELLN